MEPCFRLEESAACANSKTVMSVENISPVALGDEVYAICLGPSNQAMKP